MNSHTFQITDNLETIKKWAEERYGKPAFVQGIINEANAGEMMRIKFPGERTQESLKDVSWEVFFDIFEENNFDFLYLQEGPDGNQSLEYKFVPKTL